MDDDIYKRKCLTRFRISAHRLEIESGSYKKQPVSDRICKFCKLDQIEDEIHFLCNCSAYNFERQTFFASVLQIFQTSGYLMKKRNLSG